MLFFSIGKHLNMSEIKTHTKKDIVSTQLQQQNSPVYRSRSSYGLYYWYTRKTVKIKVSTEIKLIFTFFVSLWRHPNIYYKLELTFKSKTLGIIHKMSTDVTGVFSENVSKNKSWEFPKAGALKCLMYMCAFEGL